METKPERDWDCPFCRTKTLVEQPGIFAVQQIDPHAGKLIPDGIHTHAFRCSGCGFVALYAERSVIS